MTKTTKILKNPVLARLEPQNLNHHLSTHVYSEQQIK